MKTKHIDEKFIAEIDWELSNAGGLVSEKRMDTYRQQMELYIRGSIEELKSDIHILEKIPPFISDFASLKIKHNLAKDTFISETLLGNARTRRKGDDFPF